MKDVNGKNILENTKKLLYLLTPGPLGKGLTQKEAAEELGVSQSSIYQRLRTFKKRHPEAYKRFKTLCDLAKKDRIDLDNIWRWGSYQDLEELEDSGFFEIKGKW